MYVCNHILVSTLPLQGREKDRKNRMVASAAAIARAKDHRFSKISKCGSAHIPECTKNLDCRSCTRNPWSPCQRTCSNSSKSASPLRKSNKCLGDDRAGIGGPVLSRTSSVGNSRAAQEIGPSSRPREAS